VPDEPEGMNRTLGWGRHTGADGVTRISDVADSDLAWPELRDGVEPGPSWWHAGDLGQRPPRPRDSLFLY